MTSRMTIRELIEGKELPIKITNTSLISKYYEVTDKNKNACLLTSEEGYETHETLDYFGWELYEESPQVETWYEYFYNVGIETGYTVWCKHDDDFFRRTQQTAILKTGRSIEVPVGRK